jgi:ABC-type transporter Mla MlaB component
MGATLIEAEGKTVISLGGDLTLSYVEEMRKIFMKALVNADLVSLQFENVGEVDLSCLQLFCSAHRSAVRLKKRIVLAGDAPQALKDAAEAAGYARQKGCRLDCDNTCLWMAVAGVSHG